MASLNDVDGIVELRRSCRTKRNREEWEETLHMSVRRSRSSGNSATLSVVSMGGRPSRKTKASDAVQTNAVQTNAVQTNAVQMSFCGGCGNLHLSDDNFCRSCGMKRGEVSQQVVNLVSPSNNASKSPGKIQVRKYNLNPELK